MDLQGFRDEYSPIIRDVLKRQLSTVKIDSLRAAMAHLLGRGKLFRPLLTLAGARAVTGRDCNDLIPYACALELIHTYTLIHDDLPCMDDAAMRRGVSAVHLDHGEAMAVLAGDALFNYAFLVVHRETAPLDPQVRLALLEVMSQASHDVVEGQVLDLEGEGRQLNLEEMRLMHRLKTGALLGACCEAGAVLGGAGDDLRRGLREYGIEIGLAFQIADDLLSYESSEEVMGKSLSSDEAKQKATYARLLGLEEARNELNSKLDGLEPMLNAMDLKDPGLLREIARWAGKRKS